MAISLREKAPETLAKIAKIADQYAHGKHLFSPMTGELVEQPKEEESKNTQSNLNNHIVL